MKRAGVWVIEQGQDGNELYVVDSGQLKCFKRFGGSTENKYLKTYQPGESFGELALLYNAPRAASIQAETDCVLFALDRPTFNHIVKDAASRKRQKYEDFLLRIELLGDMDPYERSKIADAFRECNFKAGDYVVKQVSVLLFSRIRWKTFLCREIKETHSISLKKEERLLQRF
jgi:cAMP-dependent protein kinase regulator